MLETLESRWLLSGLTHGSPVSDGAGEPPPAQVAFRLVVSDLAGEPVTQVLPGTELMLDVYVQDVRPGVTDAGVFSAYLDVCFTADLLAVVSSRANPLGFDIEFGDWFQNARWAQANVPGRIDEVGAYQFGANPLGSNEFLLFRTRLVAGSMLLRDDSFTGIAEDSEDVLLDVLANDQFVTGTAYLSSSPAGITPAHDVITFAPPRVVPATEIDYGRTAVEVTTVGGHPITAVTQPTGGGTVRIAPDGAHVLYTPLADFVGTETFTYTVAHNQTALVVVQVDPVNDPPQVVDHVYRLGRNEPLIVDAERGVLRGASDPEGDPFEAVLVDGPLHGALSLQPDGSFDYTPAADFVGTDRFAYVAQNPWQASNPAEVLLEVGGPRVSLRLEVTDADGQVLDHVTGDAAAFVRVWVRDLRDEFFPDRGVFAAYLNLLYDRAELEPVLDDQLPLGFAIEFGEGFAGSVNGVAALPGVVSEVGAAWSLPGPPGAEEQLLLTLPLVPVHPRGAKDVYTVSYQSQLNLLDVLANDRALVWTTTVGAEEANDRPAHDVILWKPRSAVPTAEVRYGEATVALTNLPDLRVVEVGAGSHGGTVTILDDGVHVGYSPAAGFAGEETFTYVLADSLGRMAAVEVVVEVVPSWRNEHDRLDVNSDSFVSAIDALLIINYLNAGRPSRPEGSPAGSPFWDVSGDGYVAPIDALLVINHLNRQSRVAGGEILSALGAVRAPAAPGAAHGSAAEAAAGGGEGELRVAATPRTAVGRADRTRPRPAATPEVPALPWSEAGLCRPVPAAEAHPCPAAEVERVQPEGLLEEDLYDLLAAARHAEPCGG